MSFSRKRFQNRLYFDGAAVELDQLPLEATATEVSAVATADGTSTASAVGASTFSAVGSSDGTSTASATSTSTSNAVGSSDGTSTVTGIGISSAQAVGSSDGTSTASATATSTAASAASSDGTSTVAAASTSTALAAGSSAGTSTATAVGSTLNANIAAPTVFLSKKNRKFHITADTNIMYIEEFSLSEENIPNHKIVSPHGENMIYVQERDGNIYYPPGRSG